MTLKIYIDGAEGTTGLQLKQRLSLHSETQILDVDNNKRKNLKYKLEKFSNADLIFLCLPDQDAKLMVAEIEKNFGSKNVIVLSLIFIFIICIIILMVSDKNLFLILAVLLSSFFGPVQSASRVYFIINIPDEKKYEFFGFYSFSGKVTSFLGPVLFGTITYIFSSHRIGMASLLVLFAIGLLIVLRVENDFKKK